MKQNSPSLLLHHRTFGFLSRIHTQGFQRATVVFTVSVGEFRCHGAMHNAAASAPSAGLVTYAAWRSESERIVRLARSIAHDERLSEALAAFTGEPLVASDIGADSRFSGPPTPFSAPSAQAAMTAAAPSFLQRMLYNPTWRTESPAASPVTPLPRAQGARVGRENEATSFLQLLALAEMPSCSNAVGWPSSSTAKRHFFAEALEAVSISIANNSQSRGAERSNGDNTTAQAPSLISYSHAILPRRETASAPTLAAAVPHRSFPASAGTWRSGVGDGDGEGDFDLHFARLKHQAMERSRTEDTASLASRSSPSPTTAPSLSVPSVTAGLEAARAALDAADALLLRLRHQYRLSTSPTGRLAEAQTLLLRATLCREAQLYTSTILHAVSRRFNNKGGQGAPHHVPGPSLHDPSASLLFASPSARFGATTQSWAALTAAESSEPLTSAIQKEIAHVVQPRQHSGRAGAVTHDKGTGNGATERRVSSSPLLVSSVPGTTVEMTLSAISHSPQFTEALARWRQVVEAQQRSLRMEEVHDYLAAAQLFLGAAVEGQQLGAGKCGGDTQEDAFCCESPLMLAAHGVTHVLCACGLLLSDTLLEKEVPYPATVVGEMAAAAAVTTDIAADKFCNNSTSDGTVCSFLSNQVVLPPLLARARPHATRAWMLLVQLATFLERNALPLPWDKNTIATGSATSALLAQDSSSTSSSSGSTTQPLWELSAAVLLHRPLDALQALHQVFERTSSSTPTSAKVPLLRDLFSGYMSPLHARPSSPPASGARVSSSSSSCSPCPAVAAAPTTWIAQVQAQPGTLPLCLLSLRCAIAAAVRAHHYAEALLNTEVGLHLLREHVERLDPVRSDGHEAEPKEKCTERSSTANAAVANAGGTDYRRLVRWPEAATATQAQPSRSASVSTTKTVASAVTYLSDGVVLTMLRVLLLFLTSPVASGEAVARLQQGQCGKVPWWKRATKGDHTGLSSPGASSPLSQQERSGDDPLECAGDIVRCVGISLISALDTLDTLTTQLQLLERYVIAPKYSTARLCAASVTPAGLSDTELHDHFDYPAGEEVRLLPSFPDPEHRLEYVMATALKAAKTGVTLRDTHQPLTSGTERGAPIATASTTALDGEAPTAHPPSQAAAASTSLQRSSRSVCQLTSSAQYQRLKLAYRSRTPAGPGADASSTVVRDAGVHSEASAEEPHGDGVEKCCSFGTQSAALAALAQVVQELWTMVGALTLPLRAASTCTTPPTEASLAAVSTALAAGEPWFEETIATDMATSALVRDSRQGCENSISYGEARLALSTVEPRMERCLQVLGGRDRTVLVLLRRLQTELLFPAVCRSLA
ncbi:hypothetical protein Q4I28_001784 [Leishmania naiffi]|uniref:Uncharacterized protein n=1 Tax=Leishmania naiffi TaxID=5678 RepID=A0AAW3C286_9TRYP